jgi:hypothetical protein
MTNIVKIRKTLSQFQVEILSDYMHENFGTDMQDYFFLYNYSTSNRLDDLKTQAKNMFGKYTPEEVQEIEELVKLVEEGPQA